MLKPQLMIWRTATVDAMQGVLIRSISANLDKGINIAQCRGGRM